MMKAILFDLDRTLLDRDTAVITFAQQQYQRFSAHLQSVSAETYQARFVALDNRGYVDKARVYQQLVGEFGLEEPAWPDLLNDYRLNFSQCCVLFPGTKIVLAQLQRAGLKLGLITNGSSRQMTNIRAIEIADFFETILISEQEGVKKPEPEIFLRALTKLKLSAAETVFVGDNPIADIAGANQVGMTTIWKCTPDEENLLSSSSVATRSADGIIHYITDLPAVLAELDLAYL